jgi:DNA helicase IV
MHAVDEHSGPESHSSALSSEQEYLDLARQAAARAAKLLASRRVLVGDPAAQQALEQMRSERIREYSDDAVPLYFGRLDFEDGQRRYVGRHVVVDDENQVLVINWRAPAAEPFYRATPAEPLNVRRRRRLDISGPVVEGLTDERLDVSGDDELTKAIIAQVTRERAGVMQHMVATITPAQYELIASPGDGVTVIQGGPGTGKTGVGLHRAAWLLFADADIAHAGVLVIGPNRTFIDYVAQVLPALGERAVSHLPLEALAGVRAGATDAVEVATLKGDGRMASVIAAAVAARVIVPGELHQLRASRLTVSLAAEDLASSVEAVRRRAGSHNRRRELMKEELLRLAISSFAALGRRAAAVTEQELRTELSRSVEFRRLLDAVWPRLAPAKVLADLLHGRNRIRDAAWGILSEEEVVLLERARRSGAERTRLSDADAALLDEATALIDGPERVFGHVVVDEARDLSPMQLRMALRRSRGGRLTVLGDIAQRTSPGRFRSWNSLLATAGAEEIRYHELTISYRVPTDFVEFAGALLPRFAPEVAAPKGVRPSDEPVAVISATGVGLAEAVGEHAGALQQRFGAVAVIAPTPWHAALAEQLGVTPHDSVGRGVNLLSLEQIKGLEFDAAVVVEPADIIDQAHGGGYGALYTALTRSTRALAIVHARPLPDELDGLMADRRAA